MSKHLIEVETDCHGCIGATLMIHGVWPVAISNDTVGDKPAADVLAPLVKQLAGRIELERKDR